MHKVTIHIEDYSSTRKPYVGQIRRLQTGNYYIVTEIEMVDFPDDGRSFGCPFDSGKAYHITGRDLTVEETTQLRADIARRAQAGAG